MEKRAEARFITSLEDIDETSWDALWPDTYPFTTYRFLIALEQSGATTRESGWQPHHLTLWQAGKLVAALPTYLKTHSYGEYVFDWAWANAYEQHGYEYYPKLLSAIPFTPATGQRLGVRQDHTFEQDDLAQLYATAINAIDTELNTRDLSSWHCLFPAKHDQQRIEQASKHPESLLCSHARYGTQFHWFNRDYHSFDDFLSTFSSRKRKNLKRERQRAHSHGLNITMVSGAEIDEQTWQSFYALYHHTYLKRSGRPGYLTLEFFLYIHRSMPENILMAQARSGDTLIAAALYFRDDKTLYGRYWGTREELDGLHFECCYYQGIEYAIAHKLERFDPGAQGEHKIQRGFSPILTCSYHSIREPQFRTAIDNFLASETEHIAYYVKDAQTYLPFKCNTPMVNPNCLLFRPAIDLASIDPIQNNLDTNNPNTSNPETSEPSTQ